MALICRKCDKDVTVAYQSAPVNKAFRCKCGSADFREEPDPPMVPYELNVNDRRLLRGMCISTKDKA